MTISRGKCFPSRVSKDRQPGARSARKALLALLLFILFSELIANAAPAIDSAIEVGMQAVMSNAGLPLGPPDDDIVGDME